MNLLVVGAGICGSSLARAAQAAGHSVTIINDAPPADSLAAAAVLRRAWHAGNQLRLFDRSLDLYRAWGVPMLSGAIVTSHRGGGPRTDLDWRMLAPELPLLDASIFGHATAIAGGVSVDGREVCADRVLWATGRYGAGASGVTHGVTWIHDDPYTALVNPSTMRVHHVAPYKSVMAGVVGGRARFGSSSASTYEKAWEQAEYFKELGIRKQIIEDVDWRPVYGQRVKSAPSAALGGMHRTGYALAPAMAERIIARLGRPACTSRS